MRVTTAPAPSRATAFAPPADRQALIAECVDRILSGRPLPEWAQPPQLPEPPCPGSVAEGIARILGAPRG